MRLAGSHPAGLLGLQGALLSPLTQPPRAAPHPPYCLLRGSQELSPLSSTPARVDFSTPPSEDSPIVTETTPVTALELSAFEQVCIW